ncbi:MAG: DUF4399 domain-containing protein [Gammaproteobacteria bacterium]
MNHSFKLGVVTAICALAISGCAPVDQKAAPMINTVPASDIVAKLPAAAPRTYIISPVDGATVKSTFKIAFGLDGLGVAPAGTVREATGHHHLLIDVDTLPDMSRPLPATDNIIHFGGGQTETQVTLPPGKHTLQLLLGDFAHVPLGESMLSPKITVTVE